MVSPTPLCQNGCMNGTKLRGGLLFVFAVLLSVTGSAQLHLGAGFSGIWYNLRQDRGDNVFDSRGPYFIPGLHFRAGWELGHHFLACANVHVLLPKQEITQTYVYTFPPHPPGSFEVQDLFTTSAKAFDVAVKGYLGNGLEADTRVYLSGGLGLTRFTRSHQLKPFDTTLY